MKQLLSTLSRLTIFLFLNYLISGPKKALSFSIGNGFISAIHATFKRLNNIAIFAFVFTIFRVLGSYSRACHKILLLIVFLYTFILWNPQLPKSSGKVTYCPDGYAYKTEFETYIRCEDFDAYYLAVFNGTKRHDLELGGDCGHED